ncbi:hypothetical protein ACFOWM_00110 [Ferruginibacter yonginensis]|uniref:Nucleotide-diphospho-sugar transferase n=1 Tax=Ferruginibacter yonginensis TaxID=1310416 RepID=A0ABV8QMB4_9BACT
MFNTPILFIVFNRLHTTQQVFERIRAVRPKYLYIAADGPRPTHAEDAAKCTEVREWLLAAIDWEVELHTLFRTENVGCGKGPAGAISWFFEQVEQGIILEDDCLPSASFFPFCETLLERYATNSTIHSIAGTNLLPQFSATDADYFFSYQSGIWGWATWRRSWLLYDYYATAWGDVTVQEKFNNFFTHDRERQVYVNGVSKAYHERNVSWWDYQFIFSRIINGSYGIIPQKNLISNIGFGEEASHTFDTNSVLGFLPIDTISFPMVHPKSIEVYQPYDNLYRDQFFAALPDLQSPQMSSSLITKLVQQIKNKIKRLIKK